MKLLYFLGIDAAKHKIRAALSAGRDTLLFEKDLPVTATGLGQLLAMLKEGQTKHSSMLKSVATIKTLTKVVDGTGYVFAYNYTNRPTPVRFTWREPLSRVVESRDGRNLAVADKSWEDTFAPYDSRIYVVSGGAAAAASGK